MSVTVTPSLGSLLVACDSCGGWSYTDAALAALAFAEQHEATRRAGEVR